VPREFPAERANQLWLTDITERKTDEGEFCFCAIKDVWSTRIMCYSIDSGMARKCLRSPRCTAVALGTLTRWSCTDRGCISGLEDS
jgi:putative transposase